MKPKVLELEDKIKLMQTNMTIFYGTNHVYNHTGGNANLEEPIILDQYYGNHGDYLTYENNGIKIGTGIKHINIMANAVIRLNDSNQAGDVYVTIRKNGQKIAETSFFNNGYVPFTHSLFANYIEVKEGDLIQLYLAGANIDINVLNDSTDKQTQLTVEVVD